MQITVRYDGFAELVELCNMYGDRADAYYALILLKTKYQDFVAAEMAILALSGWSATHFRFGRMVNQSGNWQDSLYVYEPYGWTGLHVRYHIGVAIDNFASQSPSVCSLYHNAYSNVGPRTHLNPNY